MKVIMVTLIIVSIGQNILAQSLKQHDWKEDLYFRAPNSFTEKVNEESKVVYGNQEANLQIHEWPLSKAANSREALNLIMEEIVSEFNYSTQDLLRKETLFNRDYSPHFYGTRVVFEDSGKNVVLTALYSNRTGRNFVTVVESNQQYFEDNQVQIKRLSEGLREH